MKSIFILLAIVPICCFCKPRAASRLAGDKETEQQQKAGIFVGQKLISSRELAHEPMEGEAFSMEGCKIFMTSDDEVKIAKNAENKVVYFMFDTSIDDRNRDPNTKEFSPTISLLNDKNQKVSISPIIPATDNLKDLLKKVNLPPNGDSIIEDEKLALSPKTDAAIAFVTGMKQAVLTKCPFLRLTH